LAFADSANSISDEDTEINYDYAEYKIHYANSEIDSTNSNYTKFSAE